MNRIWIAATLVGLACAPSADEASSDTQAGAESSDAQVSQEWVSIPQGDRQVQAYVAYPEGEGPTPTIIVIHQNRGMSDWIQSVADRLAGEGYIAAAPDLLSGMAPGGGNTADFADSDAAREGIYALDPDQVTADLDALADYLATHPRSDGTVSVSGFCWGGSETFRFATNRGDLVAAYVFYGTGPDDAEAIARIGAPVYGFYGGADNRVTSTVETSAALMEQAGKTYDPVTYADAGHGFMSRGESADEGDPNRVAMEEGWARWRALVAERVGR
jgi:carboxymethylenebutenolidase